jgi:acyl-CoA thioesterase-1
MRLHRSRSRSYGEVWAGVQRLAGILVAIACILAPVFARAAEKPVKIVVLGDSLSAGYGLSGPDAFPSKLGAALKTKGIAAEIVNAGVSGDTATGGLDRVGWSVPDGTDAVVLELGANDALRGVNPEVTRKALDGILQNLKKRNIPVLLAGMLAPPNMGAEYVRDFDGIFPALAKEYGTVFYPFFLDGVAADATLNQKDGMHPNSKGVDIIVEHILPKVEELIGRVKTARGS